MNKPETQFRAATQFLKRSTLSAVTALSLAGTPAFAQTAPDAAGSKNDQTGTPVDTRALIDLLDATKKDGTGCIAEYDTGNISTYVAPDKSKTKFSTSGNVGCMKNAPSEGLYLHGYSCVFIPKKNLADYLATDRAAKIEIYDREVVAEKEVPFDVEVMMPGSNADVFYVAQFNRSNKTTMQVVWTTDIAGTENPSEALSPAIPDITSRLNSLRAICAGKPTS